MGGIGRGISDVMRGAAYLAKHPYTWKWVAAPFVLALLLLGVGVFYCGPLLSKAVEWAVSSFPDWLTFLSEPLKVLAFGFFAVGAYFIYVGLVAIVSAPFLEFLSEAMEKREGTPGVTRSSVARFASDVLRGLGHAVQRAALYLFTVVALFMLGLVVPFVGPLAASSLGLFVTARFAAYDAYDAIWARRSYPYQAKKAYVRSRSGRTLGLGVGVAALLAVPLVNALALPIGVAGATLAFLEDEPESAAL